VVAGLWQYAFQLSIRSFSFNLAGQPASWTPVARLHSFHAHRLCSGQCKIVQQLSGDSRGVMVVGDTSSGLPGRSGAG
jgi:hypothetical protein